MGTDTNNLKLGMKRGTKMIIFIIILILLMGMTGLTAYLFYIEEKKVKKQQTEIYLAALQDLYKTLSHSVESARKYRHDLAKHINTLERLRTKTENEMLRLRAEEIAMIFQDPSTFLNPVMTIGEQLGEVFRYHRTLKVREANAAGIEMLKQVCLAD